MDYKYIEQLLDRYWEAQTTLEEEGILRAFFRQENIPAHLKRYASLFVCLHASKEEVAGESLTERLLRRAAEIEKNPTPRVVYAQRVSTTRRFMPLLRAASAVALVLLVSVTAQHALRPTTGNGLQVTQTAESKNILSQPTKAYEAGVKSQRTSVETVSSGFFRADSINQDSTL